MPKKYRGTPAKNSAAAAIIMMIMAVPRSLPIRTSPMTMTATGTAGTATCCQRRSSLPFMASTVAIHSARASFDASEGWKVMPPRSIQFLLPLTFVAHHLDQGQQDHGGAERGPGQALEPDHVDPGKDEHGEHADDREHPLLQGITVGRFPGGNGFDAGRGQDHHDPDGRQRQGGAEDQVVRGAVPGRAGAFKGGPEPAVAVLSRPGQGAAGRLRRLPWRWTAGFRPDCACPPGLVAGGRVGVLTIVTPRRSGPAPPPARGQHR